TCIELPSEHAVPCTHDDPTPLSLPHAAVVCMMAVWQSVQEAHANDWPLPVSYVTDEHLPLPSACVQTWPVPLQRPLATQARSPDLDVPEHAAATTNAATPASIRALRMCRLYASGI